MCWSSGFLENKIPNRRVRNRSVRNASALDCFHVNRGSGHGRFASRQRGIFFAAVEKLQVLTVSAGACLKALDALVQVVTGSRRRLRSGL
jgi:hypothetical protein